MRRPRVTQDNVEILLLQAGRDLREFPSDSGVLLLGLPWDGSANLGVT